MIVPDELMDLLGVDWKIVFHDNFFTHDHVTEAVTGSGEIDISERSALLQTQILANSEAKAWYTNALYNPRYSRVLLRLRLSSMSDVLAYWGLKKTTTDPTWHTTESNVGFMVYDGSLHVVSGNSGTPSANYAAVRIADVDCTRDLLYEIRNYNFRWYSIPFAAAYFEDLVEPELEKVGFRKWSPVYSCAPIQPQNQVHYLLFYIKNLVNANRYLEVKSVTYREVYSD